jgi:hypothetical protein
MLAATNLRNNGMVEKWNIGYEKLLMFLFQFLINVIYTLIVFIPLNPVFQSSLCSRSYFGGAGHSIIPIPHDCRLWQSQFSVTALTDLVFDIRIK